MTQQDKDLLLRDLCARLPYGVNITHSIGLIKDGKNLTIPPFKFDLSFFSTGDTLETLIGNEVKPYLRPLSSLTQEERDKFCDIGGVISHRPSDGKLYLVAYFPEALDYLNSIHADYRGMIEKGLAIEVTDENNPYK